MSWEYTEYNLDELGELGRGKSKHRPRNDPALFGGDFPFIQTGDVRAANLHLTNYSETYSNVGLAQSKLWNKGTLLITIAANIAETAVLKFDACFPDSIVGFVPDESKVNAYFIKYYIDFIKLEMQQISQGTTQDNLSLDKLRTFKFKVPDKEIVDDITQQIQSYDNLIENNNRRIAILEDMAQSLYREWFVKFRFPDHENIIFKDSPLGQIPEGWEVKPVEECYKTSSGGTPSRKKPEYYGDDYWWTKTKELKDGFITSVDEKISELGLVKSSAKLFPKDTVLLAMYGATIGRLGVLTHESATNQACCALLPLNEIYSPWFIYLTLLAKRPDLLALGQGAAQQNISQQVIKGFKIISPEVDTLEIFNDTVTPIFREIELLLKSSNNLKQQRDMLLPKLISGSIDV